VVEVSLTTNSSGQLEVFFHDGDSFGVDGTLLGVLEQSYEIGLGGFLYSKESLGLESEFVVDTFAN